MRVALKLPFVTVLIIASATAIGAAVAAMGLNTWEPAVVARLHALSTAMPNAWVVLLGGVAGTGAGLLAGLIGIGGGIVVVPVVYYGLMLSGMLADQAAHVAVATSLAAILPAALVSSFGHWRAGHTDINFIRDWGPPIMGGVVVAQLMAPYVRGSVMTGVFGLLCLLFAARFAFPSRFQQIKAQPPTSMFQGIAGVSIGLVSGLAGVGGGIMTNIVMSLSGMEMHKCVGRAAAVGVVVSIPATIVAALGPGPHGATQLGSIDLAAWASIAPLQAAAAWAGAKMAQRIAGNNLSMLMAGALLVTGVVMFCSSLTGI